MYFSPTFFRSHRRSFQLRTAPIYFSLSLSANCFPLTFLPFCITNQSYCDHFTLHPSFPIKTITFCSRFQTFHSVFLTFSRYSVELKTSYPRLFSKPWNKILCCGINFENIIHTYLVAIRCHLKTIGRRNLKYLLMAHEAKFVIIVVSALRKSHASC